MKRILFISFFVIAQSFCGWTIPDNDKQKPDGTQNNQWNINNNPDTGSSSDDKDKDSKGTTWNIDHKDPKDTKDDDDTTQDSTWSVTSKSAITIASSKTFQEVESQLFSLQFSIQKALGVYKDINVQHKGTTWTLSAGSDDVNQKDSTSTTKDTFDYKASRVAFMQYIVGKDGYLGYTKQIFSAYHELQDLYKDKNSSGTVNNDVLAQFVKLPMQPGSYALDLVQGAMGHMLSFISMRIKGLTIDNYKERRAETFFQKEGDLDQITQAVAQLKELCDAQYKLAIKASNITQDEVAKIQKNYTDIFNSFEKAKTKLLVSYADKLFNYLVKRYPVTVALNPKVTEVSVNLAMLDNLYTLCRIGFTFFVGEKKPTAFGSYKDANEAGQGLTLMLAKLYTYAAIVGQNAIAQIVDELKDGELDEASAAKIQKIMTLSGGFYTSAAGYYKSAEDDFSYNAYYVFAKNLLLASSEWQKAKGSIKSSNYSDAITRYSNAAQLLKDIGSSQLSLLFFRKANDTSLRQNKEVVARYASYTAYQSALKTLVTEKESPSSQTLLDLFYTKDNKLYSGFGRLAETMKDAYALGLNILQSSPQSEKNKESIKQLQPAITIFTTMASAAYTMTYNDTNQKIYSAESDLSDKAEAEIVYGGQQRYYNVIHQFDVIDEALKAMPQNPYALLENLFTQAPVDTFGEFARTHYAHANKAYGVEAVGLIDGHPSYKTALSAKATIAFVGAQKMYSVLGHNDDAQACGKLLQDLQKNSALIIEDAQKRMTKEGATKNDYETALEQLLGMALVTEKDKKQPEYVQALTTFAGVAAKNIFKETFLNVTRGYAWYRAYLWALHASDNASISRYQNNTRVCINALISSIKQQVAAITGAESTTDKKETAQKALQELQKELEILIIRQQQEQALLGVTDKPFCAITKKVQNNIPTVTLTFLSDASITFNDPNYEFAEIHVEASNSLLKRLQKDFDEKKYTTQTEQSFTTMIDGYGKALKAYSVLGLQDKVLEVQKSFSQAIAFRYRSMVIPSDTVMNYAINKTGGTSSGSGDGSWSLSNDDSKNPTFGDNKDSTDPLYLLRYWQFDITQASDSATLEAKKMEEQKQQGETIPPYIAAKKKFYTTLLQTADALQKNAKSPQSAYINLAADLYKEQLTDGGWQSTFRTLDQEVAYYKQQLEKLANKGMSIAGASFNSTLEVTTQKIGGKDHTILVGHNMPLVPIPRFKSDAQSAIFYYSLYKKFFSSSSQPVTIGSSMYFPVDNAQKRELADRESDRAYLASATQFEFEADRILAPLKKKETTKGTFKDHKATYKQLSKAYEWIFAVYDSIEKLQKDAGKKYVDLDALRVKAYQKYADGSKLFLLDTPLDQSYLTVLKDTVSNYLFALQYTKDTALKKVLYTNCIQLYKDAGDWCFKKQKTIDQVEGYPKPTSNDYPKPFTYKAPPTKEGSMSCATPPTYSMPAGSNLAWRYYYEAQGYYSESVTLYQQLYGALNQNETFEDDLFRQVFGKQMVASLRAGLQRISLFARNAFALKQGQSKGAGTQLTITLSKPFITIIKQGSAGGALNATQGEDSLVGGDGGTLNNNAQAQFKLMKKMVLDGLIYLSPVLSQSHDAIAIAGGTSQKTDALLGGVIKCASAHTIPTLTALVTIKGQTNALPITTLDSSMVNLTSILTGNWQMILNYSSAFPSFVEYVIHTLIGTDSTHYAGLKDPNNAQAYNDFMGQINGIWRSVYAQSFLSDMLKKTGKEGIEAVQTSINTAMQAEQQQLLVDPTGYVG